MSRIGIKPIAVEPTVTVELSPTMAVVTGPNGEMQVHIPHGIRVTKQNDTLRVERLSDAQQYRALHGTVRSLLQGAVTGVTDGFTKKLELIGIGYRASMEGDELVFQLGFTHPVRRLVPSGINAKIEKNVISLSGHDKQRVGQFAAEVRSIRPPEPYKGKGVRYQGELVRMKQGKAMKAAG